MFVRKIIFTINPPLKKTKKQGLTSVSPIPLLIGTKFWWKVKVARLSSRMGSELHNNRVRVWANSVHIPVLDSRHSSQFPCSSKLKGCILSYGHIIIGASLSEPHIVFPHRRN